MSLGACRPLDGVSSRFSKIEFPCIKTPYMFKYVNIIIYFKFILIAISTITMHGICTFTVCVSIEVSVWYCNSLNNFRCFMITETAKQRLIVYLLFKWHNTYICISINASYVFLIRRSTEAIQ